MCVIWALSTWSDQVLLASILILFIRLSYTNLLSRPQTPLTCSCNNVCICCSFCQECFSPDLGIISLAPFNSQLYCHLLRENFPNFSLKQLPNLFILYLVTLFSCMSMNTLFLKWSFYWFIVYFCLPTLDYKTAILSVLSTATFLTYTKAELISYVQ